jgi:hypothetical protein
LVLTHTPLQRASPTAQGFMQLPETQDWPRAQTLPQRPQLRGSVAVSAQDIAPSNMHAVRPTPHMASQRPDEQSRPAPQVVPHVPQLRLSVRGSTHVPLHATKGLSQLSWQLPFEQT